MKISLVNKLLQSPSSQMGMTSFRTKFVPKEACNFDTFTKIAARVFGDKPLEEELLKICRNPQYIIGEGNCKQVYSIPGIKDYVLAIVKHKFDSLEKPMPLYGVKNDLEKFNFGQIIAKNLNGMCIAGKVEGEEHSLPKWIFEIKTFHRSGIFLESKAELLLNKLRNIATFPMKSYEELAAKFKYLNEHSRRVDSINPNNILVDNPSKSLNIIDLDEKTFNLPNPLNGVRDMEVLLLDSMMHDGCKKALSTQKAETLTEISKIIIEKCKAAARHVNLRNNPQNTLLYFERKQDEVFKRSKKNNVFTDGYQKFLGLYKDIL